MKPRTAIISIFAAVLLACGPDGADTIAEEDFAREHAAGACANEFGCLSPESLPDPYASLGCEMGWEAFATDAMNEAHEAELTYDGACAADLVAAFDDEELICDYHPTCKIYYGDLPVGAPCERVPSGWYNNCDQGLACALNENTCTPFTGASD